MKASDFIQKISLAQSSLSLFAAFRVEKGIDTSVATGIKNQRKVLLIIDLYIALLGISFRMKGEESHDVIAKLLDHLTAYAMMPSLIILLVSRNMSRKRIKRRRTLIHSWTLNLAFGM